MLVKARLVKLVKINKQKTLLVSARLKLVKLVSARERSLTDSDVLGLHNECVDVIFKKEDGDYKRKCTSFLLPI